YRFQRAQDRREFVKLLAAGRRPAREITAHWHKDEDEAADFGELIRARRGGREHRVKQRQRERRANTAQKRAAGEGFAGEEVGHGKCLAQITIRLASLEDSIRIVLAKRRN